MNISLQNHSVDPRVCLKVEAGVGAQVVQVGSNMRRKIIALIAAVLGVWLWVILMYQIGIEDRMWANIVGGFLLPTIYMAIFATGNSGFSGGAGSDGRKSRAEEPHADQFGD